MAIIGALVLVACPAGTSAETAERLTLIALDDSGAPAGSSAHMTFSRELAARSAGRLEVEIQPASVAGERSGNPSRSIKHAVAAGKFALGEVLLSALVRESSLFAFADIPFLAFGFEEADHLMQLARPAIEARLAEDGLMLAYLVPEAPLGLYAANEIETVEQLRGLRSDGAGVHARVAELTGAVSLPEATPPGVRGELHWASVADAAGVASRLAALPRKATGGLQMPVFYDLHHARGMRAVVMGRARFERLTAAERAAVDAARRVAETFAGHEAVAAHTAALAGAGLAALAVRQPSPALVEGLRIIGLQMSREWATGAGADGLAILAAWLAARGNASGGADQPR